MSGCQARLHDGSLRCVVTVPHTSGHVFEASDASDRHDASEDAAERGRG